MSDQNWKDIRLIACPLCDYLTPLGHYDRDEWAIGSAQGALTSHLTRKRHGLSRDTARELAKQQQPVAGRFNQETWKYERLAPPSAPSASGEPR